MPDSPSEPRWLASHEIVGINEREVASAGEPFLVLDAGKLEGALSRPINLFLYDGQDDVLTLAVALLVAVAKSHAFAQGNKRTAFSAALTFLRVNGFDLAIDDHVIIADLIVMVVEDRLPASQLEEVLARYVVPLTD